jgi:hypothetical protein
VSDPQATDRRFTDTELLGMAVKCLKHAIQSLAIRDCQCAACKGFMEQTPELLELIQQEQNKTALKETP